MVAPIDTTNTAYLAGEVVPVVESAQVSAASTLPLNPSPWHRRFTHFHNAGIQSIIIGNLVTGMRLDAKTPPDPICEPCLLKLGSTLDQWLKGTDKLQSELSN